MGAFSKDKPCGIVAITFAVTCFVMGTLFVYIGCDPYVTENLCYAIGRAAKVHVADAAFTERPCVICRDAAHHACVMDYNATCFMGNFSLQAIPGQQQTASEFSSCRTIRNYADDEDAAKADAWRYQPGTILFLSQERTYLSREADRPCPGIFRREMPGLGAIGYYMLCAGLGLLVPVLCQFLYDMVFVHTWFPATKQV